MAAKLNKLQIVFLVFGILAVVTIAVIVVPIVVLSSIKTEGVAKQKSVFLYDDISGEKMRVPMVNYGYAPQQNSDIHYIETPIFHLAQDITNAVDAYDVEVVGNIIYVFKPNVKYFYIRKLGREVVKNQGYEYRTSNSAKLLIKETVVQQETIYLPYHLMKFPPHDPSSSKMLGGYVEQNEVYETLVPYEKIVEFYAEYPFFSVQISGDTATISCKSKAFTVTNRGEYAVSYDVPIEFISLPNSPF